MAKSRNSPQPLKPRTRGLSRYKSSETKRLLQGTIAAGLTVRGIEVDPVTGALRHLVRVQRMRMTSSGRADDGGDRADPPRRLA
jgi:hypothetical protein